MTEWDSGDRTGHNIVNERGQASKKFDELSSYESPTAPIFPRGNAIDITLVSRPWSDPGEENFL